MEDLPDDVWSIILSRYLRCNRILHLEKVSTVIRTILYRVFNSRNFWYIVLNNKNLLPELKIPKVVYDNELFRIACYLSKDRPNINRDVKNARRLLTRRQWHIFGVALSINRVNARTFAKALSPKFRFTEELLSNLSQFSSLIPFLVKTLAYYRDYYIENLSIVIDFLSEHDIAVKAEIKHYIKDERKRTSLSEESAEKYWEEILQRRELQKKIKEKEQFKRIIFVLLTSAIFISVFAIVLKWNI